jgi:protein MpaA
MQRALALVALCLGVAACGRNGGRPLPASDRATTAKAREHAPATIDRRVLLGHSALGRPIRAAERGSPTATSTVLVVGCIHGNECAGMAVTRRLQDGAPPRRTRLWLVPDLDPDGRIAGTRVNGRGVDLNRNFPSEWRAIGRRGDLEYAGPRPLSEPETRIIRRLILRIRPAVTIWYHQPQDLVRAYGQSIPAARRYARLARAHFRVLRWPAGTGPNWQNHRFPGTSAFVVELPAGRLRTAAVRRHAAAVRAIAP